MLEVPWIPGVGIPADYAADSVYAGLLEVVEGEAAAPVTVLLLPALKIGLPVLNILTTLIFTHALNVSMCQYVPLP